MDTVLKIERTHLGSDTLYFQYPNVLEYLEQITQRFSKPY